MAIDPRKLKPGELARLLNSMPLGEVISERQLHRHRTRAGFRVAADGDAGKVDLFRYVAWLVTTRHEAIAEAAREPEGLTGYDAMKERARLRNAMLSLSGRDIGDLPPVADSARKEKAAGDFRFFCEAYFPQTFHLKWSDDHLKVIAKIEQAVLEGGLFAMAMPRGSGKTSLCEIACLWALVYGHREFVALVGSDEEHAAGMLGGLDSIKAELENSEILAPPPTSQRSATRSARSKASTSGLQGSSTKATRPTSVGPLGRSFCPRSRAPRHRGRSSASRGSRAASVA